MENKLIEQFEKLATEMLITADLLEKVHPGNENAAELRRVALEYSAWREELIKAIEDK